MPYYLLLHLVVLIFGFTGILGKYISVPADQLVWHRMSLASLAVLIFMLMRKQAIVLPKDRTVKLLLTGVIIAAHWITFFGAIKVSNVSVTLVCISSTAFFTAMLKPLLSKTKMIYYELILGLVVIGGIMMIMSFESQYTYGIILGLTSAFLAALFTVINANHLKSTQASAITLYEMMGGTLAITVYLSATGEFNAELFALSLNDLVALIFLAVICTAFAFMASVWVMKQLSPFTVSLSVNMEPVYAILMAFFIWRESETMSAGFYLGALVIISTLFLNAWLKYRETQREKTLVAQVNGK